MRKYLGVLTIPVLLLAYWIYKSSIEGTNTGAMPLLVAVYIIIFGCWLFSYRGSWKTFSAVILIAIPAVFVLFALTMIIGLSMT